MPRPTALQQVERAVKRLGLDLTPGSTDSRISTPRVARPPGFSSALVRLSRRRGGSLVEVDPTAAQTLRTLREVGKALRRASVPSLLASVLRRSQERRRAAGGEEGQA